MAKSGGYTIENLYEPGYSQFKPGESLPTYLGKQNLISKIAMFLSLNFKAHNDTRSSYKNK